MNEVPTIGVTNRLSEPGVGGHVLGDVPALPPSPTRPDSPYVTIERPDGSDGLAHVTFQRVPDAKTTKARLHLDLFVDNAQPIFEAMIAAGATALQTTPAGDWTTRVLQDPAGNEFCLIGPD